jgi:hypothetical protein
MKYTTLTMLLFMAVQSFGQTVFMKQLTCSVPIQEARKLIRTPDKNFLLVGYKASAANSLDREAIAIKFNGAGGVLWSKSYGGSNREEFYDVVQVGQFYYCVGYTRTDAWVNGVFNNGGPNNVIADVFLVKLKLDGSVVWAKNMGKPAPGTSITDGNDIGLRLIASGLGGVMIVVRINSGAGTNQNNGIIWVEADGKIRWANQYDLAGNVSNNELTYSIWKDGFDSYITGGWIQSFSGTAFNGGMLFKINQSGNVVWDRNTRCNPGVFESLYYGYYNHKTGKVYSTDYYNEVNGPVREVQVCTNMASTGNAPAVGAIPQAKRFHFGAAGSVGNNHRALIFPVGDGYEQFILASNDLSGATFNTTKKSTIISVDEELNFQWSKKVGTPHDNNDDGHLTQIQDIIACDSTNQSLMAVGSVYKSNGDIHILITRIGGTGTLETCENSAAINSSALTETTTAINLSKVNLNTVNCSPNCWADESLIGAINVNDFLVAQVFLEGPCVPGLKDDEGQDAAKFEDLNFIVPTIHESLTDPNVPVGSTNLSFSFTKEPKEIYFEITDLSGNFVYERFYGNKDKLIEGFKFEEFDQSYKEFIWEIEAVYDDVEGIERKTGYFKME